MDPVLIDVSTIAIQSFLAKWNVNSSTKDAKRDAIVTKNAFLNVLLKVALKDVKFLKFLSAKCDNIKIRFIIHERTQFFIYLPGANKCFKASF
jgi:hypothetical protein